MKVQLAIHATERTDQGFAVVDLLDGDGNRICQLDIQYQQLARLPRINDRALDLLLLASAVYALDKCVLRSTAEDAWTRIFEVTVPVSDAAAWKQVQAMLSESLSFLTGDEWKFKFTRRTTELIRPIRRRRRRRELLAPSGDAVSLFSGGLDSLIGVIDWLEINEGKRILLVGHHDGQMAGPYSDQKALRDPLVEAYPGRIRSILVRVGHCEDDGQNEISLRSRSLLFIALGILTASALGDDIPLLIPENGPIALNVPLTPSRRGSCSTRTTHPYFLSTLSGVLSKLDLQNAIHTPLDMKTKGDAVRSCANQDLLEQVARISVSCAKRGHKKHFTNRTARSCGRCMPCIYRRAALHSAGWDDELYGDDICAGNVDLDDSGEKPNDLRACFSFLKRNPSCEQIKVLLLANGSLDPRRLDDYAGLVVGSMNEIRTLLRDKATTTVKRLAGIR